MQLFDNNDEDTRNKLEDIILPEFAGIAKNAEVGDQFHLVIMETPRKKLNCIKIFSLEVNITFAQRKIKSLDDICEEKKDEEIYINQEELQMLK